MAATLMEIKSRMLLPRPEPLIDGEEALDPRAELVARLLEYEQFQQVAEQLRTMASEAGRAFPRPIAEQWEGAVPLVELRPGDLLEALRRMTGEDGAANGSGAGKAPSLRVRRHAVNLRQRITEVLRRVEANEGPLPFSSLVVRAGKRLGRQEVLVTFLAVLELVRQGLVTAWQRGALGEILLLPKLPAENVGEGDVEA
jgi:segregation and condensation protein A